MRYYVDRGVARSSNIQMELRLLHIAQDQISECVITDNALDEFVRELKVKQDEISKAEPRLRRVEICTDLPGRYSFARCGWLRIGTVSIVLHPVRSIIEL